MCAAADNAPASPAPPLTPRPLVGLTVAFVLGTVAGYRLEANPTVLLAAAVAWATLAAVCVFRVGGRRGPSADRRVPSGALASLCTVLSVFVAAWLACTLDARRWDAPPPDALPTDTVRFTAVALGDAEVVRTRTNGWAIARLIMRADPPPHDEDAPAVPPDVGAVQVSIYARPGDRLPVYGEKWRIAGRLSARHGPGGSHALLPFSRSPVFLFTARSRMRFVSAGHGSRWAAACYAARRNAARSLSLGIEDRPQVVGLLRALMLGHQQMLEERLRQAFVASGTLHIFAVSGLHVALVAVMLVFLLAALRCPRSRWALVLGPLLIGYTFITGARASAVRACLMAMLYWSAPLAGRRPDGFTALAAAALLILALDPSQVHDVGFILSFVAVLGLMTLYPLLMAPWHRRFGPDPLQLAPDPWDRAAGRRLGSELASLLAMSAAAWLASTPLMALYFGRFTPIALLANVPVIPLSFLVMVAGTLTMVLGACADFFAVVFNHANLPLVWLMTESMTWLSCVPGANFDVPPPPGWAVCLWYAALGLWCYIARLKAERFSARETPA
jgi:ComEC/Rec2-related protein